MRWYLILLILFPLTSIHSQDGYELSFEIDGFEGDTLFLGNHFGDKKYLADTTTRSADGIFVFSEQEELPGGMYLVVYPGQKKYFQFMLDTSDQQFKISVTKDMEVSTAVVEGSEENQIFFDYLRFLSTYRPKAETLRQKIRSAEEKGRRDAKKWQRELDKIDERVKEKQSEIMENNPSSLTAAMIRVNQRIDVPEYEGDKKTVQQKQFAYFREHYFDNINMQDPRLIRTPMMFNRVDHFIENMTVQRPDSISHAIDFVLDKLEGNEEAYRFFLSHYLNKYVRSEIVGMDAVYVHLVNEYYGKGKTPWVDSARLEKIIENAERHAPLLVGKKAPNITVQDRNGKRYSLHSIDSPFVVLLFWSPDCGHCQEAMPHLLEFYEQYKDRGVEVFAVCTMVQDETKQCWEYIDKKKGMGDWLNLVDPWLRSNFNQLYDIRSTPKIFVLDRNKRIVTKRIAAKQLPEVMDKILELDSKGTLDQLY